MRRHIYTILLFLVYYPLQFKAQSFEEKNFKLYTVKDGLSNNDVWSIEQDAYGYIWVATKIGLNRFDGSTFKQFYADSSRNSMPQDWVFKLKRLNKEQLAVMTLTGLHVVNTRTLISHNLIIPADTIHRLQQMNRIIDAVGDEKGNVFIITRTGFYQFNNKNDIVFRYDHYSKKISGDDFGLNIIRIENNTLLLSTCNGIYVYRIEQKDLHPVGEKDETLYQQTLAPQKNAWLLHGDENSFSELIQNGKDVFWFDIQKKTKQAISFPFENTSNFDEASMLIRYNDSTFLLNAKIGFYIIRHDKLTGQFTFMSNPYFEKYFCSSLFVDRKGYLWIGTNKGLFRERRANSMIEQAIVSGQESSFSNAVSILTMAIANNKVFAGTLDEGLLIFDADSLKLREKISSVTGKTALQYVRKIIKINEDSLLIGSFPPLWVNSNSLARDTVAFSQWNKWNSVITMCKGLRGDIYLIKSVKDTLYYKRSGDKIFNALNYRNTELSKINRVEKIDEDPEGNIWFSGAGIIRFNYYLQKYDIFLDSFPAIKNPSKNITSNLVFDKSGKIYFGVRENGLIIYDQHQKKFEQLTRIDGLPDNHVNTLYSHNNKVWIGTEGGIASYNISTKKISSLGIADGLPEGILIVSSFAYDSVRRQLYVAADNTILRFNPDSLEKNDLPPDFFIESINIHGQETIYHPGDEISTSYKNNSLVVNLGSVNFDDSYQQQFAYRYLITGNEPWQEIGSQRNIIFSNLSPGKHRLQVKVFIKNNSWPEQVREITIVILPPFWKTVWFILSVILLAFLAIFIFFRKRIKTIQQKANMDKHLAELEMKGLHAQMNPHFIFNSLNSIKEMILEDQKQNASRYLSKFAQLIRTNLEQSRQTFITVRQCIDHLNQYIEMEKIRFADFNYSIEVDDSLSIDDTQIAPMLIQPLVENAIWHGLKNKKDDRRLTIRFSKKNDQLVCEIEDNGIGINHSMNNRSMLRSTHKSLGVSNIHERLTVLNEKYRMSCSLMIRDRSELPGNKNGTLALLHLTI